MKSTEQNMPESETKEVNPAVLESHRADAVPVTRAYLDGHLFLPVVRSLRDGTQVTLRAITPEDEPRMIVFHEMLSDESVHFRYFGTMSLGTRTGHERLAARCSTDVAREIALVADRERQDGHHEILGIGRLIKTPGLNEAEFAILIPDRWQGEGLGTALLKSLVDIAKNAKIRIFAHVLPGNKSVLHVARKVGFELRFNPVEDECEANLDFRLKQ